MNLVTGSRDTDLEILTYLDDRSLLNLCLIKNRYILSLCSTENLWQNRFIYKFGQIAANYKPEDRSWKRHYLTVISSLDELISPDGDLSPDGINPGDPFEFFGSFLQGYVGPLPSNFYEDVNASINTLPEIYRIGYWLLDLGINKITLVYIIDRYEDLPSIRRTYTNDKNFTPADIIKLISDFYDEPVTAEELAEQQEADNPFADGLTPEDNIQRKRLINRFFEGIDHDADNLYYVNFGSIYGS